MYSTEFKESPEYAPPNVFYHTSLRNNASFSLPVPSILSILLGIYLGDAVELLVDEANLAPGLAVVHGCPALRPSVDHQPCTTSNLAVSTEHNSHRLHMEFKGPKLEIFGSRVFYTNQTCMGW
jgi:hypothetical protein